VRSGRLVVQQEDGESAGGIPAAGATVEILQDLPAERRGRSRGASRGRAGVGHAWGMRAGLPEQWLELSAEAAGDTRMTQKFLAGRDECGPSQSRLRVAQVARSLLTQTFQYLA